MDKKKIIIVDDEKDFLMIAKLNLESTNKYEVVTSLDANNLLPEIYRFKPDLILLDLLMPSIGGFELCEMFNKDPAVKGIPVIICSALNNDKEIQKAHKLGVTDFIAKPVALDELIEKIKKVLS
ncbi:response regulator [Candidatus Omnitrophota bacterium]